MSTAVKFFHSEMPSAPVLSGTAGSLLAILDACLVNGWGLMTATSVVVSGGVATANFSSSHVFDPGSVAIVAGATPSGLNGEQRLTATAANSVSWPTTVPDGTATGTITLKLAPAGWAKPFSSGNVAAYRSGSPSASGCYARVDDSDTMIARLRLYETMSDASTGIGPTPTDGQVSGGCYVSKSNAASSASRKWAIAASDRFVIINFAYHGTYVDDYETTFWGDFPSEKAGDAYNAIICANIENKSSFGSPGAFNAAHNQSQGVGVFLVRNYSQIGGAIQGFLAKPGQLSGTWSGHGTLPIGPNPINNGLDVSPTLILEGTSASGNRRGIVPGLYGIPHYLGSAYESKTIVGDVVGLPGHSLMFMRFGGYGSASLSYRYAFDISGPWE